MSSSATAWPRTRRERARAARGDRLRRGRRRLCVTRDGPRAHHLPDVVGATHVVLGTTALVRPSAARRLVRFLAGADGVGCIAFGAAALASGSFVAALVILGLAALLFALAGACRAAPFAN